MKNPMENPNFRKWFGRSKVVDKNGNPKVVYHGTKVDDFNIFRPSNSTGLIYFSEDPDYTKNFSVRWHNIPYDLPRTYPCYLRVERPLEMWHKGAKDQPVEFWLDLLAKRGISFSEGWRRIANMGEKLPFWAFIHSSEVVNSIREKFDGISMRENFEPKTKVIRAWVVFDSKQIKSATGNRGTYDPDNPDIRESLMEWKPIDNGYFISPDGKSLDMGNEEHWKYIYKYPEKFGLSAEFIREMKKRYTGNFDIISGELIDSVLQKGWVQARLWSNNEWTFVCNVYTKRVKENITYFFRDLKDSDNNRSGVAIYDRRSPNRIYNGTVSDIANFDLYNESLAQQVLRYTL